jgi:CheY-like chemotaxis protein
MAAVMERLGHRLVIANNGVEALRLLETDRFDLILMDIQMPEIDGINATKVIRSSDASWRDIPIVAVTAHASAGQREVYLSAGMDGFVAKPFKIDILIAEMARVTNGVSTGSEEQQHDAEIVELPSPDGKKDEALAAMLDELDSLTG